MPRHPPCALTNLATKMLASTVQFSKYGRTRHHHSPQTHNQTIKPGHEPFGVMTANPTTLTKGHPPQHSVLVPSGPNSVPRHRSTTGEPSSAFHPHEQPPQRLPVHPDYRLPAPRTAAAGTHHPNQVTTGTHMLLRKEVIQPHLPVRLPCYDFVPIASPTFDGSLPQRVRPPASGVTDFRDVTGGVYKARERIHRSVADLRLLATPTSRGRVADPDPN